MNGYEKKDGIKAIVLFFIAMLIPCVFDGLPTMTSLSYNMISLIKLLGIVLGIIICVLFVISSNQSMASIGVHKETLFKAVLWGIGGGCFLLIVKGIFSFYMGWDKIEIMAMQIYPAILFLLGSIEEEITFRGYIQTRLKGIIGNDYVILVIVAILFLLVHYPVMWVIGGTLPADRVIWLILLSFVCGIVYKKTDNIWSAIITHVLYNIVVFY